MIRAPLWQVAEKGKPASVKILNVQKLLGQEPTKSRVVPPAAGVTGDFKTVEQQDPLLSIQTITIKATRIAALAHDSPRRFIEIDKNLIVIRKVYSGFNTVFLSLLLLAAGVGFPAACFWR